MVRFFYNSDDGYVYLIIDGVAIAKTYITEYAKTFGIDAATALTTAMGNKW